MTPASRPLARIGGTFAAAVLIAAAATGCGSDDDSASAEEQFCAAGETLQADITGLVSVDLIAGGLDALTEQFEAVQQDVADLRAAGADVAEEELTALDDSVEALSESISGLGDDISAANAASVGAAIGDVESAASAVVDVLSNTCS